jgi:ABC-type polysaccharide/polyol phosphate export permease
MVAVYADLVRYRELLGNLFRRDVQARYRGSVLGVLWTIANPVLLMVVYLLVFSVIWKTPFQEGVDHYAIFLLVGLSLWTFFATVLQTAARSLVDNANLIRKTRFPRQLVPLAAVGANLVSLVVLLIGLLVLTFAVLPRVRSTEWLAIPLMFLFVCMVAGIALAIASLNVLFRDIEFIVAALLLPWFFLTPILYPLSGLPFAAAHQQAAIDVIHWVNFVSPGVEAVRDPLYWGQLPAWGDVTYLAVAAIVSLALGAYVFSRVDDQIAIEV